MLSKEQIIDKVIRSLSHIPCFCADILKSEDTKYSSGGWPANKLMFRQAVSKFSSEHREDTIHYRNISDVVDASLVLLWHTRSEEGITEGMKLYDGLHVYRNLIELIAECSKAQIEPTLIYDYGKAAHEAMKNKAENFTPEDWNKADGRYEGENLESFLEEKLKMKKKYTHSTTPVVQDVRLAAQDCDQGKGRRWE